MMTSLLDDIIPGMVLPVWGRLLRMGFLGTWNPIPDLHWQATPQGRNYNKRKCIYGLLLILAISMLATVEVPAEYKLFVLRALHRGQKVWGIELHPMEPYKIRPTLLTIGFQ